jgi:hypothetical protein
MSLSLNSISNKVIVFAAVIGATGIVAGASVMAQGNQSRGSNGNGNSYAANQCKDGGWKTLGYKNQGQCVTDMVKQG